MPGGYYTCGKQVLWGTSDIAQAKDNATAIMIADALNGHPEALFDFDPIMPEVLVAPKPPGPHNLRRESDEYVCSCGIRWGVDEGNEHP